ncbi:MAG: excalibur calcium-binding domain-containing protein [Ilumatobacteraceae bacterium]
MISHVVDGDTVDLSTGERVRLIGIDAPENGSCGAAEATARLTALVGGQTVAVVAGARDDVDRYGRLLRYVEIPGVDAGRTLIGEGLAVARYDSRDGYGGHPREADYVATDAATSNVTCAGPPTTPTPPTTPDTYYENCTAVWNAIGRPLLLGQPGYRPGLDGNDDGVACETRPR